MNSDSDKKFGNSKENNMYVDLFLGPTGVGKTELCIENPLAQAILAGQFLPNDIINVEWQQGKMQFKKK